MRRKKLLKEIERKSLDVSAAAVNVLVNLKDESELLHKEELEYINDLLDVALSFSTQAEYMSEVGGPC